MKKLFKTVAVATKNTVVTAATGTCGLIHLVSQTTADIALETEAAIKRKADGVEPIDTKKIRVMQTLAYQQVVIDKYQRSLSKLQSLRSKPVPEAPSEIDVYEIIAE